MRAWRGRFAHVLLVLVVALLPWSLPAGAAPAAQLAPTSQARSARAVESGLTFLMDRYAQPLEPAPLLQAAWTGIVEGAPETLKQAIPAIGPAPIAGDRTVAWAEFQRRFEALMAVGGDVETLTHAANRAMARSLDDCHTRFAPSYDKELASYEGGERYGGIGASALDAARFQPQPPGPVIVGLVDGGPAAIAGIRLGDSVIGV